MKIVDGFLSFLGFENSNSMNSEKKLTEKQIDKQNKKKIKKQEKLEKKYLNEINKKVENSTRNDEITNLTREEIELKLITVSINQSEDAKKVIESLMKYKKVILDLSKTEQVLANRSLDFVLGALFILKGDIKRIDNSNQFIISIQ